MVRISKDFSSIKYKVFKKNLNYFFHCFIKNSRFKYIRSHHGENFYKNTASIFSFIKCVVLSQFGFSFVMKPNNIN